MNSLGNLANRMYIMEDSPEEENQQKLGVIRQGNLLGVLQYQKGGSQWLPKVEEVGEPTVSLGSQPEAAWTQKEVRE